MCSVASPFIGLESLRHSVGFAVEFMLGYYDCHKWDDVLEHYIHRDSSQRATAIVNPEDWAAFAVEELGTLAFKDNFPPRPFDYRLPNWGGEPVPVPARFTRVAHVLAKAAAEELPAFLPAMSAAARLHIGDTLTAGYEVEIEVKPPRIVGARRDALAGGDALEWRSAAVCSAAQ